MKKPSYITEEAVSHFINLALSEDIGDGDHSSLASIPKNTTNNAILLSKDIGIVAGVGLSEMIFKHVEASLEVSTFLEEGAEVKKGDIVLEVSGDARAILKAERIVLNCIQRMSGIATHTKMVADKLAGTSTKVLDTRKTTPNFRMFEKWAVLIGGGENHRFGLFDMIMLKDNHIDYAGGVIKAAMAADEYRKKLGKSLKIEIETRNIEEVNQALSTGVVDVIMLDNMTFEEMRAAVKLIGGRVQTEASGGITLETVEQVAKCGVDYISMGALTYGAKPLDFSLKAKQ